MVYNSRADDMTVDNKFRCDNDIRWWRGGPFNEHSTYHKDLETDLDAYIEYGALPDDGGRVEWASS